MVIRPISMKIQLIILFLTFSGLIACKEEKPLPANYIRVNIEGTTYTFLGRSIVEPKDLMRDTLKNMTYLGGYVGDCIDGTTEFIEIRINHVTTGNYGLSDGVSLWMQTNNNHAMNLNDPKTETFSLTISEYGDEYGRIVGTLSGINPNTESTSSSFTGDFSLKRLPDHSFTAEVSKELCPKLYEDYK